MRPQIKISYSLSKFHLFALRRMIRVLMGCRSSFTYRNFLSYSLGQIRMLGNFLLIISRYPFITKYARENGIIDTSTVLECYGVGETIKYHLVLEHQEYFAGLREMEPIIVDSEFRKNHV